jgi:hypothetical protein
MIRDGFVRKSMLERVEEAPTVLRHPTGASPSSTSYCSTRASKEAGLNPSRLFTTTPTFGTPPDSGVMVTASPLAVAVNLPCDAAVSDVATACAIVFGVLLWPQLTDAEALPIVAFIVPLSYCLVVVGFVPPERVPEPGDTTKPPEIFAVKGKFPAVPATLLTN